MTEESQEREQRDIASEQRLSKVPENLRAHAFPPGVSGNPSGRPKGSYSVVEPLRRLLAEDEGKRAEDIAKNLLRLAVAGDESALGAIREILERADGKVEKQVRNTGEPTVVVINGPRQAKDPT